jgi:hypothetical protein
MDSEDLMSRIEAGVSSGSLCRSVLLTQTPLIFYSLLMPLVSLFAVYNYFLRDIRNTTLDGLLNYLLRFQQRLATDPRYKLFALYRLMNDPQVKTMKRFGNYSESTVDAYRNTTMAMLKSSRNLDVLSVPHGNTATSCQLPSCAADWSDSSKKLVSLVG